MDRRHGYDSILVTVEILVFALTAVVVLQVVAPVVWLLTDSVPFAYLVGQTAGVLSGLLISVALVLRSRSRWGEGGRVGERRPSGLNP